MPDFKVSDHPTRPGFGNVSVCEGENWTVRPRQRDHAGRQLAVDDHRAAVGRLRRLLRSRAAASRRHLRPRPARPDDRAVAVREGRHSVAHGLRDELGAAVDREPLQAEGADATRRRSEQPARHVRLLAVAGAALHPAAARLRGVSEQQSPSDVADTADDHPGGPRVERCPRRPRGRRPSASRSRSG